MTRSREHLYRMIEQYISSHFDYAGAWRNEDPGALVDRIMTMIHAGMEPHLNSAAASDAIETIRHAAEQGKPIRLDGRGPWYRLTECEPPAPHQTRVLAVTPEEEQ